MRRRLIRLAVVLAVAGGTLAHAGPANAFMFFQCTFAGDTDTLRWDGTPGGYRFSSVSFPQGSKQAIQFDLARLRWNNTPGGFTFNAPIYGDTDIGRKNGQNEAWFTEDYSILGATATALNVFKYYCPTGEMKESDLIFRLNPDTDPDDEKNVVWSYTDTKSTKTRYDDDTHDKDRGVTFGAVAMHELGHLLPLFHENREYNMEGDATAHLHTNDGKVRFYAGEDAGDGEAYLYGETTNSNLEDLGVSHWKYKGEDGEYSDHELTRIYEEKSDNSLGWKGFEGEKRFRVNKGQIVRPQFTFENNGLNTQFAVEIGYYISTNDRITTSDTLIATHEFPTIGRDNVRTMAKSVTIPNNIASGQTYWLGVIIDRVGAIDEHTEWNNATRIPIYVL